MLNSFGSDLNVCVIGASGGIGSAFVEHLIENENVKTIYALSRSEKTFERDKVISGAIDLTDEDSVHAAAAKIDGDLHLVIVASGMLHDENIKPEKSLRDLNMDSFQKVFATNTFGPALAAKYFLPKLPREGKSLFAALSARVGSIEDNQIGGWYTYRASKAALNMILKNAAIETGRRYKEAAVIGVHPGTVDTELSQPFQGNVDHEIFSPKQSAKYLLNVVDQRNAEDTGKIFDWENKEIPY